MGGEQVDFRHPPSHQQYLGDFDEDGIGTGTAIVWVMVVDGYMIMYFCE